MKNEVFISYSSQDADIAFMICDFLEAHLIGCWIAPRNILPGNSWSREIIKGLKESLLTIVVYSDASNASDHVANELAISHKSLHPIIPFKISDQEPIDDIRAFIDTDKKVLAGEDQNDDLERLLRLVLPYVNLSGQRNKIEINTDFEAVINVDGYLSECISAGNPYLLSIPEGEFVISIATKDNEFEKNFLNNDLPNSIDLTLEDLMAECGRREIQTIIKYTAISEVSKCYGFFKEGVMRIDSGNDILYINRNGDVLLNLNQSGLFFNGDTYSEGLIPAQSRKHDKPVTYSYINLDGDVAIDYEFDYAYEFSSDLATVQIGKQYGVIDKNGKFVIEPNLNEAMWFNEGLMSKQEGEKYGYIDTSLNFVIEPKFNKAFAFHQGVAIVEVDDKSWYINHNGERLEYLGIHSKCYSFSRFGLAVVKDNNSCRLINIQGKTVAQYSNIRRSYKFYDFYVVTHNGLTGLIYPWGEICVPPIYEFCDDSFYCSVIRIKKDSISGILCADGTVSWYPDGIVQVNKFMSGMSICENRDGKKGIVDRYMNIICPPIFDDISISDYELMCVEHCGLKGYINHQGKMVIPCIFDYADYGFGKDRPATHVRLGVHEFQIGLNGQWIRNIGMMTEQKDGYIDSDCKLGTIGKFKKEYNEQMLMFHHILESDNPLEASCRMREYLKSHNMLDILKLSPFEEAIKYIDD